MTNAEMNEFRMSVRQAVADYIWSEGCGCCQDKEAHIAHAARLAKLLRIKPYPDGSGFDFAHFRSKS